MILQKFASQILNKDIKENFLKLIIYMLSTKQNYININDVIKELKISKKKLINEIGNFRNIEGFLIVSDEQENNDPSKACYKINVLDFEFIVLNEKSKAVKKPEANIDLQKVFDYWIKIMKKDSKTILDKKRERAILTGLDNNSVDTCCLAILGCSKDPWNMGKHPDNNKLFNSLELIFRSQEYIEKFVRQSEMPDIEDQVLKKATKNIEERLENNDWVNQRMNFLSENKNFSNKEDDFIVSENLKIEKNEDLNIEKNKSIKYLDKFLQKDNKNNNDILEIEYIPNNSIDDLIKISEEFFIKKNQKDELDDTPYYIKIQKG